ncbi:hypothetical protein BGZ97_004478, partial [Linnemannia gamsii]
DLNNNNMFNLTWKIVLCPPGSAVHYRVETVIPEEEGHPASMYPPIVEGTLSDTQRHCSLLLGTNNRQKITLVVSISVELHDDVIARGLRFDKLNIR